MNDTITLGRREDAEGAVLAVSGGWRSLRGEARAVKVAGGRGGVQRSRGGGGWPGRSRRGCWRSRRDASRSLRGAVMVVEWLLQVMVGCSEISEGSLEVAGRSWTFPAKGT